MPKQVDHDQRRNQIAAAVARLAMTRGLRSVSFREVAVEAGMSVANVQHYFSTKHDMLAGTLDRTSTAMSDRIGRRLAGLDTRAGPLEQIRAVAAEFVPIDDVTRGAMLVYHGFAAAGLTDPELRSVDAFSNGQTMIDFFAERLRKAQERGEMEGAVHAELSALALVSLVIGLSLGVLLEQVGPQDALDSLDEHLRHLGR